MDEREGRGGRNAGQREREACIHTFGEIGGEVLAELGKVDAGYGTGIRI